MKLAERRQGEGSGRICNSHVTTLGSWLQYDILPLAGCNPIDREKLFDFVLVELTTVAAHSPRILAFAKSLIHQKEGLLAANYVLSREFQQIGIRDNTSEQDILDICGVAKYNINTLSYHNKADVLVSILGVQYDQIEDEVLGVLRCSSILASVRY